MLLGSLQCHIHYALLAHTLCSAHPNEQALELDALLAAGSTVQQGGVRTVSPRGVALFDVIALKDELLKR